jgi:hypothetical protein
MIPMMTYVFIIPIILIAVAVIATILYMGKGDSSSGGSTSSDSKKNTTWSCKIGSADQGDVTISWGHTAADAKWACDQWKSVCGNNPGGCTATPK